MKKYKLVKTYKGSPEIDTEIVETMIIGSRPKFKTFTISGHDKNCDMGRFRVDNPEISPEYWQEIVDKNPLKLEVGKTYELQYIHCKSKPFKAIITKITSHGYPWMEKLDHSGNGIVTDSYRLIREIVDRDYEILAFKENNKPFNKIWKSDTQLKDCFCIVDGKTPFHNSYKLISLGLDIHSVKRLSDNTIFTIGDYVNYSNDKKYDFIITSISIKNNDIYFYGINGEYSILNNKIKHIKKPLFTTEDGVDITPKLNGEFQYWRLQLANWKISSAPLILNSNKIIPTSTEELLRVCNVLRFSTKEKAEEYILMNKPCLSIEEVMNISYNPAESYTSSSRKLKELVKSKL
jgi:hypothetical protein